MHRQGCYKGDSAVEEIISRCSPLNLNAKIYISHYPSYHCEGMTMIKPWDRYQGHYREGDRIRFSRRIGITNTFETLDGIVESITTTPHGLKVLHLRSNGTSERLAWGRPKILPDHFSDPNLLRDGIVIGTGYSGRDNPYDADIYYDDRYGDSSADEGEKEFQRESL